MWKRPSGRNQADASPPPSASQVDPAQPAPDRLSAPPRTRPPAAPPAAQRAAPDGTNTPQPRTIRVFTSSTFGDMQADRDHLAKVVFPQH
jgi:hypothetical protein